MRDEHAPAHLTRPYASDRIYVQLLGHKRDCKSLANQHDVQVGRANIPYRAKKTLGHFLTFVEQSLISANSGLSGKRKWAKKEIPSKERILFVSFSALQVDAIESYMPVFYDNKCIDAKEYQGENWIIEETLSQSVWQNRRIQKKYYMTSSLGYVK